MRVLQIQTFNVSTNCENNFESIWLFYMRFKSFYLFWLFSSMTSNSIKSNDSFTIISYWAQSMIFAKSLNWVTIFCKIIIKRFNFCTWRLSTFRFFVVCLNFFSSVFICFFNVSNFKYVKIDMKMKKKFRIWAFWWKNDENSISMKNSCESDKKIEKKM